MATRSLSRTPSACAYHPSNIIPAVSPYPSHCPGGLRKSWSAIEPYKELNSDRPAARLDGIVHGNVEAPLTQDGGTVNSNGRIGRHPRRISNNHRSFSPDQSPGHFEVRGKGRMYLARLQEAAPVKANDGKRNVTGRSGLMKALVAGSHRESDRGRVGSREVIQGYCNWLLDGSGPRVRSFGFICKAESERSEFEYLTNAITLATRCRSINPLGFILPAPNLLK